MRQARAFAVPASLRRDIVIMVSLAALSLLTACGDSTPEGGRCPEGQVLRYESAGCGADAKPVCGSPTQDACYRAVCSCQGQTISRCDYAPEPFAYFGTCPIPDGAGPDVPSGLGGDTAVDAAPDLAKDVLARDQASDQASEGVLDAMLAERPADLMLDATAPIDIMTSIDIAAPDVSPEGGAYDAGPCFAGQVLRYESPGCGAEARPVCGSGQQDACYRAVCSCRGETISRCDYAPEPFASFGPCQAQDGGGID